jgi:glycerol-3-phosphate dehydrogenase
MPSKEAQEEFFPNSRSKMWVQIQSQEFDLMVIGGGITGAGIARDATLRGLNVALVEKKDYAWGTSSRSSKLAHGGFRYLEHFKFGLVMESLRERKVLMTIAPHNVHPIPFYIPVYEGEKPPAILLRLGLIAYEYLSIGKRIGKRKWHSKKKALEIFPALKKEGLKGMGQYYDCQMNDARLCLENILTAVNDGATILNYVEVLNFDKDSNNRIKGVIVKDLETGNTTTVKAKIVVNATGPWSDFVKSKDEKNSKKRLANSKGVHIITKRVIEDDKALAIALKDGRIIFVLPFKEKFTLIGTTDTFYDGDIENIICLEDEVEYLLEGYNRFFPENQLTKEDVISSYAGVRPLVFDEKHGADSKDVSREHRIFQDKSRLISIIGGKYTTYRRMAKTITDLVVKTLQKEKRLSGEISKCRTDKVPLKGGNYPNFTNWDDVFTNQLKELQQNYNINETIARHLIKDYGILAEEVLSLTKSDKALLNKLVPDSPYIYAEVVFSIENEYCRSLEDFYWLRTFLALETDFSSSIGKVVSIFAKLLKWDDERVKKEREIVFERMKRVQFRT